MIESPERHFWTLVEPLHAITYFAPEAQQAFVDAGLRGFWRGYFAGRAAPLGAVEPGVVTATFFGFHPSFVERSLPDIWGMCSPEAALQARLAGVDAAWQAHLGDIDRAKLRRAAHIARSACESVAGDRRPLFAANEALDWPDEPHLALWHATTLLREHRGDGHIAALTVHGLGPCEAHLLRLGRSGESVETLTASRGWVEADWIAALGRLAERELVDETGQLAELGIAIHDTVEELTDELARRPVVAIQAELAELANVLGPIAGTLADTVIPYPNPMGVEQFDPT
jgi:hypothetical protein